MSSLESMTVEEMEVVDVDMSEIAVDAEVVVSGLITEEDSVEGVDEVLS